jgi:hypothetical protein
MQTAAIQQFQIFEEDIVQFPSRATFLIYTQSHGIQIAPQS